MQPVSKVLQDDFDHLAKLVELFEQIGDNEGGSEIGQFCRIVGITLAKFNHLLLGCYSLALDGLAQESGALLRPLIETYELLIYFRQDRSRIEQALENKLPSAGTISKKISGSFQDLRKYLNKSAAHFGYDIYSVRHLFGKNAKIKVVPNHSLEVFHKNLQLLNAFQIFMVFEAINCLDTIGFDVSSLIDEVEEWRNTCVKVFAANMWRSPNIGCNGYRLRCSRNGVRFAYNGSR